jgi:hypothetical protein
MSKHRPRKRRARPLLVAGAGLVAAASLAGCGPDVVSNICPPPPDLSMDLQEPKDANPAIDLPYVFEDGGSHD